MFYLINVTNVDLNVSTSQDETILFINIQHLFPQKSIVVYIFIAKYFLAGIKTFNEIMIMNNFGVLLEQTVRCLRVFEKYLMLLM